MQKTTNQAVPAGITIVEKIDGDESCGSHWWEAVSIKTGEILMRSDETRWINDRMTEAEQEKIRSHRRKNRYWLIRDLNTAIKRGREEMAE